MQRRALPVGLLLLTLALTFTSCTQNGSFQTNTGQSASPHTLGPNSVVDLLGPAGVAFTVPSDGRLRGYGFSAVVTGVGNAATAGTDPNAIKAGGGHHLVVFALSVTTYDTPDQIDDGEGPVITADVMVDDAQLPIDTSNLLAAGQDIYAVSVPNGAHQVELHMTAADLTQSFSLITLQRVGPQPTVLYRDHDQPTVTVSDSQTVTVPVTVPADGFSTNETLGVTKLTMTNFQPGNPTTQPADPNQAYLVVTGSDASDPNPPPGYPSGSHFVGSFTALPGSALTLTLPNGEKVVGTHSGSTTYNLLDGSYYFTVPADLTSASLAMTPGTVVGAEYPVYSGDTASVDFLQPANFTLALPPVPAAPKSNATPITVPTTASRGSGNHSRWATWLLILGGLVLVVLLAGFCIYRRRRQHQWRSPTTNRPLLPIRPITDQLAPPVPLALPAAPQDRKPSKPDVDDPSQTSEQQRSSVIPPIVAVAARTNSTSSSAPNCAVEVRVLGPIEVTGWRQRPRRKVVTALLCYLSLHPGRPISGDQVLTALWPLSSDRREASRASLHTYASELRRSLPEGILPDASTTDGYLLSPGVASDWSTFVTLCEDANDSQPVKAAELWAEALTLVRGTPCQGATSESFEWITTEHHLASMEVAISRCAHQLSAYRLARGDSTGAEEAARRGLSGVPDSALLFADLIRAAEAGGDPSGMRRAWRSARRTLGEDGVASLIDEFNLTGPTHRSTR